MPLPRSLPPWTWLIAILVVFQIAVLRRKPPNLRRIVMGFVLVLRDSHSSSSAWRRRSGDHGAQLSAPQTIGEARLADGVQWHDYLLVYAFAAAIGFATTVAEPSLIASP